MDFAVHDVVDNIDKLESRASTVRQLPSKLTSMKLSAGCSMISQFKTRSKGNTPLMRVHSHHLWMYQETADSAGS